MSAGRVDLQADRWVPFAKTISITGYDLSLPGAAWHGQVRLVADAPGAPQIDLPAVTDTSDGIRLLSVDTTGDLPVSLLLIQIAKLTISGMPAPAEPEAASAPFDWDMLVTPAGGIEIRLLAGKFFVLSGVTRDG